MKIYARQVNPEYQESPLFLDDESFPENIAVCGNRDYKERLPEVFARVRDVLNAGELATELEYIAGGHTFYAAYTTATEAITAYLPPVHKDKYSTKDIHALKMAVMDYAEAGRSLDEESALLRALDAVTGKEWACREIHGVCQGDWNQVYYPADEWSPEALAEFEAEYFNTGTEWIIHDGETAPEGPEDIDGFSFYCTEWDDEKTRQRIREERGTAPDDEVILYKWAGYTQIPRYEKA